MSFPNLGKRLMFIVPAVPIAWWTINTPVSILPRSIGVLYPGQLLVILLTFIACYEYTRLLRSLYPGNGFWLSYLWLAFQFVLYATNIQLPYYLSFYVLLMIVAIEAFAWGRPRRRRRWVRASLLFSGVAFLYMCAISLVNFYYAPFQQLFIKFSHPMLSQLGICLIVLTVALCDSFAYFVGCTWGRHKFSTISPNKTVEGAIGGFIAALITASVGWWFLATPAMPKGLGFLLGVLIGVFSQVGDLVVSLMKRYFQVKDASDLIPGHGGVLDRFGSLFFTAPAVSIFCWIVNRFVLQ
ncbi:MAG: phosphatidate cytidylyltransferase [Chitinispirillaceae bacterium]|nr:phosphatidate cytidylyltransferase [Chitinispirillaceae bacterium]